MRGPGGHIKERVAADGKRRFIVAVELEADPATGKRRQVSGGTFRTKREAQRRLGELLNTTIKVPTKMTLGEFIDEEWLPSKADLTPATQQQYRWAAERIVDRIGAVRLKDLTVRHVQDLYAGLRDEQLSPRSRQVVAKALRNLLSLAVQREHVVKNVADAVPAPSTRNRSEIEFWSSAEARQFLNTAVVQKDRLRSLWFFALSTGLRRQELVALRWSDVDLRNKRLVVRQAAQLSGYQVTVGPPKTKASIRTVGLDESVVAELKMWMSLQNKELAEYHAEPHLVFSEVDGSMIHPQTLALRFTALVKKAGVRPIGLHGLRHTHATIALEAGVALKVVSERLGHSSVQITADTYQHALEHMQHDAATAIGALLLDRTT